MRWLETKVKVLGALPDADVAMAKAILAAWNGTDGNNSIGSYGLQPADISLVWGDRDGWTLANFYNWWNKSGWAPPLPNPTTKNEIAWQDLTTQGLYSLKSWAQAKGITIVPGQLPNPGFPSAPAPSAPVPSAPSPQVPLPRVPTPVPGNPSDVTQCDPGFPWDPVSKLCVVTPLPIPPAPIPGGGAPSSSEGSGNTGILIAVGALVLLGIGAAIFGGGSGGAAPGGGKSRSRDNPRKTTGDVHAMRVAAGLRPGPVPMSGYAYATTTSGNWRTISDENWDTEVITPDLFKWTYVGQRSIDGVRVNVWRRGPREYIAQTARGGDPRDY